MRTSLLACVLLASWMRVSSAETNAITVTAGEKFRISLPYNSSTGYKWQFPTAPDAKLIKLVNTEYSRSNPKAIGSGGDETWTFKALAEGKTELKFAYSRPWESGAKPAQATNFVIVIKPAKVETNKPAPPS